MESRFGGVPILSEEKRNLCQISLTSLQHTDSLQNPSMESLSFNPVQLENNAFKDLSEQLWKELQSIPQLVQFINSGLDKKEIIVVKEVHAVLI